MALTARASLTHWARPITVAVWPAVLVGWPRRVLDIARGRCAMHSVHDIAAYILQRRGTMTAMKLQKLVYYAQAWSLALRGRSLFREEIQAWAYGPVVYELFKQHRGQFAVAAWPFGDPGRLRADEAAFVNAVVGHYGAFDGAELSELSHADGPWLDARTGLPQGTRCARAITREVMRSFYSQRQPPFQLAP